jgi:tetratricopeptide (TPR) repeat protein
VPFFSSLLVETTYRLGMAYWARGDHRRATDFLAQMDQHLQGEQIYERFTLPGLPAVNARAWLAECLAELGDFAQGIARGEEAVRLAEVVDHPFSLVGTYQFLGALYLHQGDVDKAIPVLERALALCQAAEIRLLVGYGIVTLGYAYSQAGRVGEGLQLLEQGVDLVASRLLCFQSFAITWLSEAYLLAGRVENARELAVRALRLARERKERGVEAWALRLHGEIATHADPPEAEPAESF